MNTEIRESVDPPVDLQDAITRINVLFNTRDLYAMYDNIRGQIPRLIEIYIQRDGTLRDIPLNADVELLDTRILSILLFLYVESPLTRTRNTAYMNDIPENDRQNYLLLLQIIRNYDDRNPNTILYDSGPSNRHFKYIVSPYYMQFVQGMLLNRSDNTDRYRDW